MLEVRVPGDHWSLYIALEIYKVVQQVRASHWRGGSSDASRFRMGYICPNPLSRAGECFLTVGFESGGKKKKFEQFNTFLYNSLSMYEMYELRSTDHLQEYQISMEVKTLINIGAR